MNRYYYLVAQLPYLQFGAPAPLESEELITEARKWITDGEFQLLRHIDFKDTEIYGTEPAPVRQYKEFEKNLREELVAWREAREEGIEHKPVLFNVGLLKEGTPLDREENLLRLRWDFIEELETGRHFDYAVLVLYALKLQILEKLDEFDSELGMEKFKHYTEVSL